MGGYDSFLPNKVSALRLNEDLIKCMAMQLIPGPLFFQEARGGLGQRQVDYKHSYDREQELTPKQILTTPLPPTVYTVCTAK